MKAAGLSRPRVALLAAGLVVLVSATLWVIFRYLIVDAALLLDYIRVLIWPAVVTCIVLGLRDPLQEKLRQLLNIDVLGVKAGFSQLEADRALESELRTPIDLIVETATDPTGDDEEVASAANVIGTDPANGETQAEGSTSSALPLESSVQSDGPDHRAAEAFDEAEEAPAERVEVSGDVVITAVEQFLGIGPASELLSEAERVKRLEYYCGLLRKQAEKAEDRSSANLRNSVEDVVKLSAGWGYDMAKAGRPRSVPEIEWRGDGGWHIMSETPAPTTRTRDVVSSIASRQQHITRLEAAIERLEKASLGGVSTDFASHQLMKKYKNTLSDMDPGNPFSR